jgi:hypothetical protein
LFAYLLILWAVVALGFGIAWLLARKLGEYKAGQFSEALTFIEALATDWPRGRTLFRSLTERLLVLPDHLLVYPAHYSGSVCGRGLSGNPASTVGFERRHNAALRFGFEDEFVAALLEDIPPAPEGQAEILAANRLGRPRAPIG